MAANCKYLRSHVAFVGCLIGMIKIICFHRQQILELQIQRAVIGKEINPFNRYMMHAYGAKGVAMVNLTSNQKKWKSEVKELLKEMACFHKNETDQCFFNNEKTCRKLFDKVGSQFKYQSNAVDIETKLIEYQTNDSSDEYIKSACLSIVEARIFRQNTMAYYHITYGNRINFENFGSLSISRLMFPFMIQTSLGKNDYGRDIICQCTLKNKLKNEKIKQFFHNHVRNIGKK
jgi:hypothetical protein